MGSDYDPTEFVDGDFHEKQSQYTFAAGGAGQGQRAPTVQEVDARALEKQQKIAELARAKEEKERELASLEETRRRQLEFKTGREEMIHNLTRGLGLLHESEFAARRDAEQMAKTLGDLKESLTKVEAIREETWSGENFEVELTRALTTLENARMEWNSARLKFAALSGQPKESAQNPSVAGDAPMAGLTGLGFGQLCRLGLALTWPLLVAALALIALLVALLARR